jgi:hypothetical protein
MTDVAQIIDETLGNTYSFPLVEQRSERRRLKDLYRGFLKARH